MNAIILEITQAFQWYQNYVNSVISLEVINLFHIFAFLGTLCSGHDRQLIQMSGSNRRVAGPNVRQILQYFTLLLTK